MEIVFGLIVIAVIVIGIYITTSRQRYRDPGQAVDSRNLAEYGVPAKTLYTATEVFTLHHRIEVTDEQGNVAYRAETQFPSIHDKTDIYAADGRHVAYFERKILTLHEIHYVDMENGKSFTLSNELMHLIKDVTNIEELGWVIRGNILALNFTISDSDGGLIALVSQKVLSIHDKYAVDIYRPEFEEEVVAVLITLQHMIRDREASAGGGSSGASSSN